MSALYVLLIALAVILLFIVIMFRKTIGALLSILRVILLMKLIGMLSPRNKNPNFGKVYPK